MGRIREEQSRAKRDDLDRSFAKDFRSGSNNTAKSIRSRVLQERQQLRHEDVDLGLRFAGANTSFQADNGRRPSLDAAEILREPLSMVQLNAL
jgi:hypothetical protein